MKKLILIFAVLAGLLSCEGQVSGIGGMLPVTSEQTQPVFSGIVYDGVTSPKITTETAARTLTFSSDGYRLYLGGPVSDAIFQYDLSTAWDVSTAIYNSVNFSVKSQDEFTEGIVFNDDGTMIFVVGQGNKKIFKYDLSIPWDVSTAIYNSVNFSVLSQCDYPEGVVFNDDGTRMFVLNRGIGTEYVYQYDISTPWDISTATYNSVYYHTGLSGSSGIQMKYDGTKMYIVENSSDIIFEYDLSTPWDMSTATYNSVYYSIKTQSDYAEDLYISNQSNKLYIIDFISDYIYQYTITY